MEKVEDFSKISSSSLLKTKRVSEKTQTFRVCSRSHTSVSQVLQESVSELPRGLSEAAEL